MTQGFVSCRFLTETLSTIPSSTPYDDVVFKPARLSDVKRETPEIVAQRDQDFLAQMEEAMERQTAEEKAIEVAKENSTSSTTTAVVQRNVARRMTGRSPQKKIEPKLVTGEGDKTLSNFFHSLLNRRTSAPVDRPLSFGGARTLAPKHISKDSANSNPTESDDSRNVEHRNLHGIYERNDDLSRKSSDSSENEPEDSANHKLQNTAHLSLDQQDKEGRQLPEYFLSNPGSEGCSSDCSFQKDSSSFDLEDDFSSCLDRVTSSFNPPLRLLLEDPEIQSGKDMTNGEVKYPAQINVNGVEKDKGSEAGSLPPSGSRKYPTQIKANGFEKEKDLDIESLTRAGSIASDCPMSSMPLNMNGTDSNSVNHT